MHSSEEVSVMEIERRRPAIPKSLSLCCKINLQEFFVKERSRAGSAGLKTGKKGGKWVKSSSITH